MHFISHFLVNAKNIPEPYKSYILPKSTCTYAHTHMHMYIHTYTHVYVPVYAVNSFKVWSFMHDLVLITLV